MIPIDSKNSLEAFIEIPSFARGMILFVHGSGSSRFSPRNQFVAEVLRKSGFATVLFDLLTKEEERVDQRTSEMRFNIPFLTERLLLATRFLHQKNPSLSIGYFGASTGAAAALCAAAEQPQLIHSVVSRGGRPDLAGKALAKVQAATLFLIGTLDLVVIDLNRKAFSELHCQKKMQLIKGASHLFEEPGTLQLVAEEAVRWFKETLHSSL